MISIAEVEFRAAYTDWEQAKKNWTAALSVINRAKMDWENAQLKFFGNVNVMSSAASCGSGCGGCSTGGCNA